MTSKTQKLELGDFEIGFIKRNFDGKKIAFVAVSKGLGVVIEDKVGYWPVPSHWFYFQDVDRVQEYADQLNQYALNIDADEAMKLVGFSMFGSQKIKRRKL